MTSMKKTVKISLLTSFVLSGLISIAQESSSDVKSKMLARAAALQLKTTYKPPPGDAHRRVMYSLTTQQAMQKSCVRLFLLQA